MATNQMDYKQLLAVVEFLKENEARLMATRPTYASVAEEVSKKLGERFTENNIRAAAQACDIVWLAKRYSSMPPARRASRILARAIVQIAAAVGVELDPNVERIARGRRQHKNEETN